MHTVEQNEKTEYEPIIQAIANYALNYRVNNQEALNTARLCLMDSLGCAMLALDFPECTKLLGPMFDETSHDGHQASPTAATAEVARAAGDSTDNIQPNSDPLD